MAPPKRKASDSYHHGDLRHSLLEVAVALIAERGIEGLSLRECARRLGVSHAAPYRHFADKGALLAGVATRGFQSLTAAGRSAIADYTDPIDRLDAYGVAYVRFAMEHPEYHRVMFTSQFSEGEASDQGAFELLLECVRPLVDSDEEAVPAAVSQWSLVHGLSMLILDGRLPEEAIATPEAVEELTRHTFRFWRTVGASR